MYTGNSSGGKIGKDLTFVRFCDFSEDVHYLTLPAAAAAVILLKTCANPGISLCLSA